MSFSSRRHDGLSSLLAYAVVASLSIGGVVFGIGGISASFARSQAGGLRVSISQPTLKRAASGQQLIRVEARTERSSVCQAVVRVRRVRGALTKVKTDAQGRVAWRWLILPSSPSGIWRITVACRHGHLSGSASTRVLVVTKSKKSKGPIGDPRSLATPHGTPAGKGGGTCGPFEPGQCTCLAYQKRPDVYNTAVAHGVPAGGRRAAGPEFYVWDGEQWLVNAQRAGIPTGSQPVAGALVVWGVPNSAAYGHVAYVEQVSSSTRVLISECNYDWHGSCRTIWENPQAAANLQGYIYGGPASNGPGSGPGSGPGGPGSTTPSPPTPSSGERALAVGAHTSGEQDVFWKGQDSNLWETFWAGNRWNGPFNIGMGPLGSSPAVAVRPWDEQDVFWKGQDSNLWETFWAGNRWNGPFNIGMGPLGSAPTVAVRPSGEQDVFWDGTDGNLWEAMWAGASWVGPTSRGMGILGSAPSTTAWGTEVDVFWGGGDANVWEGFNSGSAWHGPYKIGMGPIG